jgi:hypothetical protein
MAVFEVQIKSSIFLATQLRALKGKQICPPQPYRLPPPLDDISIQLQKFVCGKNSIRHSVEASYQIYYSEPRLNPVKPYFVPTPYDAKGFRTQIAQELELLFVLTKDILEHPNQVPASSPPIPANTSDADHWIELLLRADGGCVLLTTYNSVEWGALPALPAGVDPSYLRKLVEDGLAASFGPSAIPFNFAPLLPPDTTEIANAGMSVDSDLQRVAFRVDPAGGNSYNDLRWTPFYSGIIPDRLQGADWALFIDGKVMETSLSTAIDRALKVKPQPKLKVSSVGGQYSNAGNTPQVITTIHAFINAPVLNPLYVDPKIVTVFSLQDSPNNLVVDVHLDQVQELIDSIVDFAENLKWWPPLWGFLAYTLFEDDIESIKGTLGGIEPPQVKDFVFTKLSDVHYRGTLQPPVPSVPGASMRLNTIAGLEDGIALSGSMTSKPFTPSELQIAPAQFAWALPKISCGQASRAILDDQRQNPTKLASLYAEVDLTATGTEPIYLCSIEVTDSVLVLLGDGSARLFTIGDGHLKMYGLFSAAPWFANSLRLGNVFVQVAPARVLYTPRS